MNRSFWIILVAVTILSGCGGEPKQMPPEMVKELKQKAEAVKAAKLAEKNAIAEQKAAAEASERQRIATGQAHQVVGKKGSRHGGDPITESVSIYFGAREATVFKMQIPHAMKIFKTWHERYPKDWDEFKKDILDPASIDLPELPDGKRYYYDPEKGELMIETIQ